MMSKMRCDTAIPGGVIFDVSVPQKKLIQQFTAAEATKQVEKGMLDGLTLGRMYMENQVTKYLRRSTTLRKETRAKWKRIHVFKPEKIRKVKSPCIMCVQSVHWGCSVHQGGYHEYIGGDTMNTSGGAQYIGGIS